MKTGRYPLVGKRNSSILCIIFLSFLFQTNLLAQNYILTFRNLPLSDALVRISGQLNIKVAFDSKKLGGVTINRDVTGNTPEEVISDLLHNSGFEYRVKYGRFLIVEKESAGRENSGNLYQLVGSVSDKKSDERLPYATIILYDKNLLIPASENGTFCIRDISANPVHLTVSYIGYNPVDTMLLLTDPETNVSLKLNNRIRMLDSIEVKSTKLEMVELRNDVDFATTVNVGKLNDLPALAESDIFRMLQVIPGVSYPENSQGLSIRGGSSDQNLVLFDGQTIYNLSHYYGMISALNPNVVKDIQVYKGGYDSRFGERVSGIVDITGKTGSLTKPSVYGDINLISGNLTAEIPIAKKLSFIGAFRRSYNDIYSTSFSKNLYNRNINQFLGDSGMIVNQTRPKYYFYDYNSKLTFRPNDLESYSVNFYGGKDYFLNSYSGISNLLNVSSTDKNVWNNYSIGASWLKQWNASLFTNFQAGTSGYDNDSENSTRIDKTLAPDFNSHYLPARVNSFKTYSENKLNDLYLSARSTWTPSASNQFSAGLLVRRNKIYYYKDADSMYVYNNMNQSALTASMYLQDRITLSERFTLKPGLRVSYFDNTGRLYAEPRFAANYRFSDAFSVRAAVGKYYQFVNQVLAQQETGYNRNFWVLADGKNHPAVISDHFIAGFTFDRGRFMIDAEAYYKTFDGMQEYIYVSQFLKNSDFPRYFAGGNGNPHSSGLQPSYFVTGQGKSYGIDLLLRYKGGHYTTWFSYSEGRSIQNFAMINKGGDIPSPSDIPFQLTWTNMISAGGWNFGTFTIYSAGRPYIIFGRSATEIPAVRTYNRLPDYFRSDVSVNYNLQLRRASLKPGITLINIFNNHNYFDVNTRKFDFTSSSFSEATLVQSQPFSVNLFLHFVF